MPEDKTPQLAPSEAPGEAGAAAPKPAPAKPKEAEKRKAAKPAKPPRGKADADATAKPAEKRPIKPKQDPEQVRLKKEEQNRRARRRNRQLIGLALAILIVVGAVSIVQSGVAMVRGWMDSADQLDAYQRRFEPLVWFYILPFDSVSQVDENAIKEVAIWGVLNNKGDDVERNANDEALVPQLDVDQYGINIFGPDFRFSGHSSFFMQDLEYVFDAENQQYIVPITGFMPEYLPSMVEMNREASGERRLVVGYVSTRTSDNQLIPTPDYEHPAFYMDFMLRRDGSEYYLYAIRPNTTYVPASASSAAASSAPGSLPSADDSSLPQQSPAAAPSTPAPPDGAASQAA